MSKAITEKTEDKQPQDWRPGVEIAPSLLREDEPTIARTIGLVGASFVIFGAMALFVKAVGWGDRIGIGWASVCLALGVVGLLGHASYDRDIQVRRLYWGAGLGLLGLGAILCLVPAKGEGIGALFGVGYPCFYVALFFLLAVLHHETDPVIRRVTIQIIGGAGLLASVVAFLFGNNLGGKEFLVPYGSLLAVVGLVYLTAFVSQRGIGDDVGYRAGLGIGGLGLLAFVLGLLRTAFAANYLVPGGLLYMGLGLLFMSVSLGLCSDHPLIVLTRRELATYFFSPLMYMVLVAMTAVAWFGYKINVLDRVTQRYVTEPIFGNYVFGLFPVLTVIFLVPALTMRLLSEEKRTGSLEVLLTAPVKESTVVWSKFLAGFLLYMLLWTPWWLFLVALRVDGGQPFDYRSLFSFVVAQVVMGAGFISMGLFFSSLTRNQVASAVLTFALMILLTGVAFLEGILRQAGQQGTLDAGPASPSPWITVLNHMNYIDVWERSMDGTLIPRQLLFHVSFAAVWLFLTIKVLEARRWA
jgi:ABC-2 type transport system permease protein